MLLPIAQLVPQFLDRFIQAASQTLFVHSIHLPVSEKVRNFFHRAWLMRSAKRNQYFWQLQPKLQLHINVILAAIKFSYAGANIANIRHLAILANIFAIFATPFRRIYQHRSSQVKSWGYALA